MSTTPDPNPNPSDLTQLWQAAVDSYEKNTGQSLQPGQFRSMDEVMDGTEALSQKFKGFRDDESKVSKVRTAFRNNMWLVQDIVGTVQRVGGAASAFPPTMPASLIFTAFGQVMQSFADVSADYEKIMGFFDFTHQFFDRLSIIDRRMPDLPQFQRCVSRVFSSILEICAVAQTYCKEKRFKKWFDSLLKGTDGGLAAASAELEAAVNELSQAVGLTTLRTVEVLDEVIQSMDGKVEFLVSNATLIDERTQTIQSHTATIMAQNQAIGCKQDELTGLQRGMLEKMSEQSRMLNDVVGYLGSVQMGESFGKGFQTSLLKMSVIRLRLTRWGESVGLANFDVKALRQTKISAEDIPRVEELLEGILDHFADAERISQRLRKRNASLGVLDPTKELDEVSASLQQTMSDLVRKRQGNAKLELKTTDLILYEEKNFTRLIEDVSGLVDDLVELFPAVEEDQRKLCEEEVSAMKKIKNGLPVLKEAAAGQDQLLSETVLKVIQQTTNTAYNHSVVFQGSNSGFQIGSNRGNISNVRFH